MSWDSIFTNLQILEIADVEIYVDLVSLSQKNVCRFLNIEFQDPKTFFYIENIILIPSFQRILNRCSQS